MGGCRRVAYRRVLACTIPLPPLPSTFITECVGYFYPNDCLQDRVLELVLDEFDTRLVTLTADCWVIHHDHHPEIRLRFEKRVTALLAAYGIAWLHGQTKMKMTWVP